MQSSHRYSEKDQIAQDYVRQQEKVMKSTFYKSKTGSLQKEKCKSRKNQVQSESLTENNETPIVSIDKKKSKKQN